MDRAPPGAGAQVVSTEGDELLQLPSRSGYLRARGGLEGLADVTDLLSHAALGGGPADAGSSSAAVSHRGSVAERVRGQRAARGGLLHPSSLSPALRWPLD